MDDRVPGRVAAPVCAGYAAPMEERRGSAWFGLPAMLGVAVVVAVLSAVEGLGGLIIAAVAVLVLFLVIGLAMTLADKR